MEDEQIIDDINCEITDDIAYKEYTKLERVQGDLDKNTNTNIWSEMRKAFSRNRSCEYKKQSHKKPIWEKECHPQTLQA